MIKATTQVDVAVAGVSVLVGYFFLRRICASTDGYHPNDTSADLAGVGRFAHTVTSGDR